MTSPKLPGYLRCIGGALMLLTTSTAQAKEVTPGADVTAVGFPGFEPILQTTWCNEYPPSPPACPDTMFGGCGVSKKCADAIDALLKTPSEASLLTKVDAACLKEDKCGDTASRLTQVIAERETRIAGFRCGKNEEEILALVSTDPILSDGTCRDRLDPYFRALAEQRCNVVAKMNQCRIQPPPLAARCAVTTDQAKELGSRETALCAWTLPKNDGVIAYLAECQRVSNGEDEAQCLSAPLMMERLKNGFCTKRAAVALPGPPLSSEPLDITMSAPLDLPQDDACLFGRGLEGTACGPTASGVRVGHAIYHQRVQRLPKGELGQVAAFFPYNDDPSQLSVIRFSPTENGEDFPATRSPAQLRTFFGQAPTLCSIEPQERLTAQAYQLRRMAVASDMGPVPVSTLPAPVPRLATKETPLSLGDCGWQEGAGLLCWRHAGALDKAREGLTTWRPMAAASAINLAEAENVGAVLQERFNKVDGQIYVAARSRKRLLTWATGAGGFAAHALSPLEDLSATLSPFDAAWLTRQLELAPAVADIPLRWWLDRAPLTAVGPVPDTTRICWRQGTPGPGARLFCGVYGTDKGITQPLLKLLPDDRRKVTDLVDDPAARPFFKRLAELPGDCLVRWLEPDESAPTGILSSAFLLECGVWRERFWMSVTSDAKTTLTLSDPGAMALLNEPSFATREQARAHRAGATSLRLHSPVPGVVATFAPVLSARIGTCIKVRDTDMTDNVWIDLGDLLEPDLMVLGGMPAETRAKEALDCLETPTENCNNLLLSWRPFLRQGQPLPPRVRKGLSCDG